MRWILVLLILYIIPLTILFKNNHTKKRAYMHASSYIVTMTTIVIMNIYISGLNDIKETMYYSQNIINNTTEEYRDSTYEVAKEEEPQKETKETKETQTEQESALIEDVLNEDIETSYNYDTANTEAISSESSYIDSEIEQDLPMVMINIEEDAIILEEFRKQVYTIEERALLPMKECIAYTNDLIGNLSKLDRLRSEVEDAYNMCRQTSDAYDEMEIPQMSNDSYTQVLEQATTNVKIAYELRQRSMESILNLIDTKNPMYIGDITQYLFLSDEHISIFKEKLRKLEMDIKG